ncbi:MAG: hypothetical protein JXQ85_03410 [Cognatishimia sp.]|uniref:hypothetical protein n=1 Tax=Cognatishimia sp. TaxID=2211648 RepID=UPI003B8EA6CC
MLISKITVIKFERTLDDNAYDFVLCVHAGDHIVQFRDIIPDTQITASEDLEGLIAQSVVRQINQLPEIRSGDVELEIAGDLNLDMPEFA